MWLLYLEALRTGAVLLCSTSLVRKSLATLVGMGVSDRVKASVKISTICICQLFIRMLTFIIMSTCESHSNAEVAGLNT